VELSDPAYNYTIQRAWMCDLYSITTNQAAIIALFRVINRFVGNLPSMPGVFPDYPAPVMGYSEGGREMVMMRCVACRSLPPPQTVRGIDGLLCWLLPSVKEVVAGRLLWMACRKANSGEDGYLPFAPLFAPFIWKACMRPSTSRS
jgi:hypothetical protein